MPKLRTVCCRSAAEVERVARRILKPPDRVIEIGSQLNEATALLRDLVGAPANGGQIFAFDVRRKLVSAARGGARTSKYRSTTEMAGVTFTELTGNSAFEICTSVLATLGASAGGGAADGGQADGAGSGGGTVIVLDASNLVGNDLLLDFVTLIQLMRAWLGPALGVQFLVIKSKALHVASRRFLAASRLATGAKAPRRQKQAAAAAKQNSGDGGSGEATAAAAEPPAPPPSKPNRFLAHFHDELAQAAAPTNKVGCADAGPVVVGARGVHEYRAAARLCILPGDRVLEIGCHCGRTTELVAHEMGGLALGVDIGPKVVREAEKWHPDVAFRVADAWDTRRLLELAREFGTGAGGAEGTSSWDVILVDVGGLSGDNGLLEALALVRQLAAVFRPTLKAIVIKSACVRTFAASLLPVALFLQ